MATSFQWWVSPDDEGRYYGPYLTKDLALADAVLEGHYQERDEQTIAIYICEAQTPTIEDLKIEQEDVINTLESYYEEYIDEDGYLFPDLTQEDKNELGLMLNEALREWAKARNIRLTSSFVDTRNEECVMMPKPDHVKKLEE